MQSAAKRNYSVTSTGSIVFDDRGNASWLVHHEAKTEDSMIRLLDTSALALADDDADRNAKGRRRKAGFDPYDSGS